MKKGIDAPLVPAMFLLIGMLGLIMAIHSGDWTGYIFPVVFWGFGGLYLHTSLIGKYRLIKGVVKQLALKSEAQVLDLGTGHGAFLLEIAQHLQAPGKIIGLDIWNQGDQSGNSMEETHKNVEQLGVSDVCELVTGDMTQLPFADNQFDEVVASLSIHNVKPKASRGKAIDEAYRVLKPGGHLVILDIEHVGEYRKELEKLNVSEVTVQHTGINGLYGALSTKLLIAQK